MHWLQGGTEGLAEDIRAARGLGCQCGSPQVPPLRAQEYADSLVAFSEIVVPLVNEG